MANDDGGLFSPLKIASAGTPERHPGQQRTPGRPLTREERMVDRMRGTEANTFKPIEKKTMKASISIPSQVPLPVAGPSRLPPMSTPQLKGRDKGSLSQISHIEPPQLDNVETSNLFEIKARPSFVSDPDDRISSQPEVGTVDRRRSILKIPSPSRERPSSPEKRSVMFLERQREDVTPSGSGSSHVNEEMSNTKASSRTDRSRRLRRSRNDSTSPPQSSSQLAHLSGITASSLSRKRKSGTQDLTNNEEESRVTRGNTLSSSNFTLKTPVRDSPSPGPSSVNQESSRPSPRISKGLRSASQVSPDTLSYQNRVITSPNNNRETSQSRRTSGLRSSRVDKGKGKTVSTHESHADDEEPQNPSTSPLKSLRTTSTSRRNSTINEISRSPTPSRNPDDDTPSKKPTSKTSNTKRREKNVQDRDDEVDDAMESRDLEQLNPSKKPSSHTSNAKRPNQVVQDNDDEDDGTTERHDSRSIDPSKESTSQTSNGKRRKKVVQDNDDEVDDTDERRVPKRIKSKESTSQTSNTKRRKKNMLDRDEEVDDTEGRDSEHVNSSNRPSSQPSNAKRLKKAKQDKNNEIDRAEESRASAKAPGRPVSKVGTKLHRRVSRSPDASDDSLPVESRRRPASTSPSSLRKVPRSKSRAVKKRHDKPVRKTKTQRSKQESHKEGDSRVKFVIDRLVNDRVFFDEEEKDEENEAVVSAQTLLKNISKTLTAPDVIWTAIRQSILSVIQEQEEQMIDPNTSILSVATSSIESNRTRLILNRILDATRSKMMDLADLSLTHSILSKQVSMLKRQSKKISREVLQIQKERRLVAIEFEQVEESWKNGKVEREGMRSFNRWCKSIQNVKQSWCQELSINAPNECQDIVQLEALLHHLSSCMDSSR